MANQKVMDLPDGTRFKMTNKRGEWIFERETGSPISAVVAIHLLEGYDRPEPLTWLEHDFSETDEIEVLG